MTNTTTKNNKSQVLKKAHKIKHLFPKLGNAIKFAYAIKPEALKQEEKREQLGFFKFKKPSNNQLSLDSIDW
jgi:hypothetical protein